MWLFFLWQGGQKYTFTFDKVFSHEASQQDVFVEISQLVQSALDGYKVIFAVGLFDYTEKEFSWSFLKNVAEFILTKYTCLIVAFFSSIM